jgi:hypothetical protein
VPACTAENATASHRPLAEIAPALVRDGTTSLSVLFGLDQSVLIMPMWFYVRSDHDLDRGGLDHRHIGM